MTSTVGQNIRLIRMMRGKKQKEMAKEAQIPPKRLGEIENGLRDANPSEVQSLTAALNVPAQVLEKNWSDGSIFNNFHNTSEEQYTNIAHQTNANRELLEEYITELKQDKAALRAELQLLRQENARLLQSEAAMQAELRLMKASK